MTKDQYPDTTTKLWDYLYKVRVPYLNSRTIEDIRTHGVRISGIPSIDKDIANQWFTTMLSVATMADYFAEGVSIKVCSQKDIKEIYDSISNHIHAWKTRLEHGINIGDAPISDLILLDKFANTIYEHAKYQFTKDIADSFLVKQLAAVQRVGAHNFFEGKALAKYMDKDDSGIVRINASKEEENLPDRDSLGEFFKNRLMTLRRF